MTGEISDPMRHTHTIYFNYDLTLTTHALPAIWSQT